MLTGGGPTVLSIGGAGIFDGIFVTGVLAVILAAYAGGRGGLRKKGGCLPAGGKGVKGGEVVQ